MTKNFDIKALNLNFSAQSGIFLKFMERTDAGTVSDSLAFSAPKSFSDSSFASDAFQISRSSALSETITVSDDFQRNLTTIRTANETASSIGAGLLVMQSYMANFSYFEEDFVGVSRNL